MEEAKYSLRFRKRLISHILPLFPVELVHHFLSSRGIHIAIKEEIRRKLRVTQILVESYSSLVLLLPAKSNPPNDAANRVCSYVPGLT